jgi:hypothetical protein
MLLPQDLFVLAGLAIWESEALTTAQLAGRLQITPSQTHLGLKRAEASHLVVLGPARGRQRQSKRLHRAAFSELLVHGVRYVYPAVMGGETRGVPTFGRFAPTSFAAGLEPVWPHAQGDVRGLSFEPLAASAPLAARLDESLYLMLACIDAIRGGQARERRWAVDTLTRRLKG